MTSEILIELATQLPAAGALLALSVFFGRGMGKYVASSQKQMVDTETRHSAEMRVLEDRFLEQIRVTSGECHAAQNHASDAISDLASATHEGALVLGALSAKVDTAIDLARKGSE